MRKPLTVRDLLEQLSDKLDVKISVTIEPGTRSDEVLDHELWLVPATPTAYAQVVVFDGVIYLTNRKELEE